MFHIKAILAVMIVAWLFEVQPLSRDKFWMFTCVHLDASLWWGIHGLCREDVWPVKAWMIRKGLLVFLVQWKCLTLKMMKLRIFGSWWHASYILEMLSLEVKSYFTCYLINMGYTYRKGEKESTSCSCWSTWRIRDGC